MITQVDLDGLVLAASFAGFEVNVSDLQLQTLQAGANHLPVTLLPDYAAVYIFKYGVQYLKVGKVNSNSNARYQSQHYNPDSSRSNLSRSIFNDLDFYAVINGEHPGNWLKQNSHRYNILIPARLGKKFVHFAEAFFILKCNPRYEDTRA